MPTLDESVDIYRTARATAWSYRLAAYEEAARADLLKVVEEAKSRMLTRMDAVRSSSRPSSRADSFTRAKIRDVQVELERISAGLQTSLGKDIVVSSARVGSLATDEHMKSLSLEGVIPQANTVALSPSQFTQLLLTDPPGGIPIPKVVAGMLDRTGVTALQKGILDELKIGALTGASYDKIVRSMSKSFGVLLPHQLTTITRTYFQTANAKAFDEVYKANKDILNGKIWTSANDDRVCLLCLPLGGTFYKFGETHPPMPRHPRCRCLFRPKTKSLKELGLDRSKVKKTVESVVTRGTLKDGKWTIPPVNTGTRAPARPIVAMPGGLKEGFGMLPEEAQLSMLGRGRFDLYKAGELKLDDLVNRKTGALTPLKELQQAVTPAAKEAKELAITEAKDAARLARAATKEAKLAAKLTEKAEKAVAEAAKAEKEAAAIREEIRLLQEARALEEELAAKVAAKEATEKAYKEAKGPASKWDKLPLEKAKDLPTSDSVRWASLTDIDARAKYLDSAKKLRRPLPPSIIDMKTLEKLHEATSNPDYIIDKDATGYFAMSSGRVEALYRGDTFDMLGARPMTMTETAADMEHALKSGRTLYKLMVPRGSTVIPVAEGSAEGIGMALLPGTKLKITGIHGGVRFLEMVDDGREYTKDILKLYDHIEMTAGRNPLFGTPAASLPKVEEIVVQALKPTPGVKLSATQKKALKNVQEKCAAAEPQLIRELSAQYRVSEETIKRQIKALRDGFYNGDIELCSNTGGSQIMYENLMTKQGRFKNQFELGSRATSGGHLDPRKGSARDKWEKVIYGNVFQQDKAYKAFGDRDYFPTDLGRERPYYGYVNTTRQDSLASKAGGYDPARGQYGKTAFVFDPKRVAKRVTFTMGNSSGLGAVDAKQGRRIGTPDYPAAMLYDVYANTASHLSKVGDELASAVDTRIKNSEGLTGWNSYAEVQYMGDLSMEDVLVVVSPAENTLESWELDKLPYVKRLVEATGHPLVYKESGESLKNTKEKVKAAIKELKAKRKS